MGKKGSHIRFDVPCSGGCGTMLQVGGYSLKTYQRHFCTKECRKNWYKENLSGDKSPIYCKTEHKCDFCGNTLLLTPWDINNSKTHFCNKECMDNYVRTNQTKSGDKNGRWLGGIKKYNCDQCGIECERSVAGYNWNISNFGKIFCGKKCSGQWKSDHNFGDKSPNWLGGRQKYPILFRRNRPIILEKYNNKCVLCGEEADSVHHIDYNTKNNDPSNLIPLCVSCHIPTNYTRYFWESLFKYLKAS